MSSTKFVFFGPIGKQDGRPSLLLAETFWTSSLKPLNGIQRNLLGSKISMSSTKFVFFGLLREKERDLTKAPKPTENPKSNATTQKRYQKLRLHNDCGPT